MSANADLQIQPYADGDALTVFEAAQESLQELKTWMPWAHDGYSLAESEAWVAAAGRWFIEGKAFEFKIVTTGGRYLGGCGLNDLNPVNRRANVGYWVRRDARGQGVATAAVSLVKRWAMENTDLHRLEILVASGNAASLRVAAKSGATFEGTMQDRLLLHGVYHSAAMFSLLLPARG